MVKIQIVFHPSSGKSRQHLEMSTPPRVGDGMRLYENGGPFLATVEEVLWTPADDHDAEVRVATGFDHRSDRRSRRRNRT